VGVLRLGDRWYGNDPSWYLPFEGPSVRFLGKDLHVEYAVADFWPATASAASCGQRVGPSIGNTEDIVWPVRRYLIDNVRVLGRRDPVQLRIEFVPSRLLDGRSGWNAMDFPHVYADECYGSPHRYSDGALCLYYPKDPVENRWTADKGLVQLVVAVQNQLFIEDIWRETGEWLSPQAPHGFAEERKRRKRA